MASVIDNREQKMLRLESVDGQYLSRSTYNAIIGGVLCFGLLLNAVMTVALPSSMLNLMDEYPLAVVIGFFVLSIGSIFVIYRSDSPVVSFIGFMVLSIAFGYLVAVIVQSYTSATVTRAYMMTAAITVLMIAAGTVYPKVFASMGRTLFAILVITLVAEAATMLVTKTDPVIFDWIFVAVFALYIGYDWQKAQAYPPTANNAVDSAADIYVDIINLFIRLLAIFGRRN